VNLSAQLGNYIQSIDGFAEHVAQLVDIAVTDAHANASSAEIQALVMLAEAKKTVSSIGDILLRVFRIIKAAKRLDLKYLLRQISKKELAARYLELRYALRPLVYDAKGVLRMVESTNLYKATRATARGFQRYDDEVSDTILITDQGDPHTVERSRKEEWNCRAGVLTDVYTTGLSVSGADQLLESAWELIPFSFIIDWFINIGSTIAAWSPSAGVEKLTSWVVRHKVTTCLNTVTEYHFANQVCEVEIYNFDSCQKALVTTAIVRDVNPELSKFPAIKVDLSTAKLADLILIIKQTLRL
jgi:hypothetical protein